MSVQETYLAAIADAIRAKEGSTDPIPASSFAERIAGIQTGVDTSDATATAADIATDKTAYVNGERVVGNALIAPAALSWTQTTLPVSASWRSVTYGNDKFVAVPTNGTNVAVYSTDGITWTQATLPSSRDWTSVTYGNGMFVAVSADSNVAAYSTDGIEWTKTTIPAYLWSSVTYGDGKFVAVSTVDSNVAAYSTDGINWTQTTLPASIRWRSVAYGDGKFVAVADSSSDVAAYSTDGINWTQTTLPVSAGWYSVTYGNGKFVSLAYNSDVVAYSTDGITWVQATLPVSAKWYFVAYGDGKFVAVTYNSDVAAYSTDGINWTQTTLPASAKWYSVAYGDGMFVSVSYGSDVAAYCQFNYTASLSDIASGKTAYVNGELVTGTGIRRWVTNDDSIVPTGSYATSTYYDTTYGVKIGYMADGNILLSMKGGTTAAYEKLHFTLDSAPDGVSIEIGSSTNSNTSGSAALIYACVLIGIKQEVTISIAMGSVSSANDYTTCAITVTAV